MIFYDYIKGIHANADSDATIFSKIIFQAPSEDNKRPVFRHEDDNNNDDYGNFLTSSGSDQSLNTDLTVNVNKKISISKLEGNGTNSQLSLIGKIILKEASTTPGEEAVFENDNNKIKLTISKIKVNDTLEVGSGMVLTGGSANLIINSSNGYVQAPYFVATSDREAKENIAPLSDTLDIIRNIQVYTFNYKGAKDRNIGVIAQDLQKIDDVDFTITPEQGFTVIKESKLVYLLWKATQEMADQIEKLTARVDELEQALKKAGE